MAFKRAAPPALWDKVFGLMKIVSPPLNEALTECVGLVKLCESMPRLDLGARMGSELYQAAHRGGTGFLGGLKETAENSIGAQFPLEDWERRGLEKFISWVDAEQLRADLPKGRASGPKRVKSL